MPRNKIFYIFIKFLVVIISLFSNSKIIFSFCKFIYIMSNINNVLFNSMFFYLYLFLNELLLFMNTVNLLF